MSDYIRARSPQQKEERMDAILSAADFLFQAHTYHEITLSTIARELGWSRANLYKYVDTKEQIFLLLYTRKHEAYLHDLEQALIAAGNGEKTFAPLPDSVFAQTWARATAAHQNYLKYQDILVSIIETNVSVESLAEFKATIFKDLEPLYRILAAERPTLSSRQVSNLYFTLLYHASGLYNHFNCCELTKEAMKLAGLPPIEGDFSTEMEAFVLMCLKN